MACRQSLRTWIFASWMALISFATLADTSVANNAVLSYTVSGVTATKTIHSAAVLGD